MTNQQFEVMMSHLVTMSKRLNTISVQLVIIMALLVIQIIEGTKVA